MVWGSGWDLGMKFKFALSAPSALSFLLSSPVAALDCFSCRCHRLWPVAARTGVPGHRASLSRL